MSNAQDLIACMDALQSIPNEQVQEPNMPVDVFIQEAENLYHWCEEDRMVLAGAGLTPDKVEALNVRAGACRETQSIWVKDRRSIKEAQEQWNEQSPAAYDLRDELLHAFRYAFRSEPVLLNRVAEIAEGDTHSDMIQDLNDLAVLGHENQSLLMSISLSPIKLDEAADMASDMADLLAAANGDRATNNASKELRDRAYTYLKDLVDEVRSCGKYVFWRNPKRLKGYSSDFWRKRNQKKSKATTEENEEA